MSDTKQVFIYGLIDPRDSTLRYIGKTNRLKKRLGEHIVGAKRQKRMNIRLEAWIIEVLNSGKQPEIIVLEKVARNDWKNAEMWWIDLCLQCGLPLVNVRPGGNGLSSEESPWYGVTGEDHPTYGLRRYGEENPMWGRKQSEETKELISQRLTDLYSEPTRTPWYGKHLSEEHKQKIREAKTGVPRTEEFRTNLREKMMGTKNHMHGRKHTLTAKRKMRVSSALYRADKKGDGPLVLVLQQEYFELYGRYHEKYSKPE